VRSEWTEERIRDALAAADRVACRALVCAVIETAADDLRQARGRDLESAIVYLTESGGELERWHADFAGLDLGALRRRARLTLELRFGVERAAKLWDGQPAPAAAPRRRRRTFHEEHNCAPAVHDGR
jgi:hypothetical protein